MPDLEVQDRLQSEWKELLSRLARHPRATRRPGPPRGRSVLSAAGLLAELEEVRLACLELRASPLIERYAERYVNTNWTFRELVAHLASWAKEFRREVETAIQGGGFDYVISGALSAFGPNEWNQAEVERRASESLSALLEEFEVENRALADLVVTTPEPALRGETRFPLSPTGEPGALFQGSPARLIAMKCLHDRYHLGQIQARLQLSKEIR